MRPYANNLKNISGGGMQTPAHANNEILDSRLVHQCEIVIIEITLVNLFPQHKRISIIPTQQKGVEE